MSAWWSEPNSGHAYILSLVSIIITLIAAVVGIVGYAHLDDSLILIYGLENIVDFFSSAIVLWRFNDPKHTITGNIDEEQQRQRNLILSRREKRASIGVSIVLGVLGFGGVITSLEDLISGKGFVNEDDIWTIYYLSFSSFVIFGALTYFKLRYARKLNSPSLRKDGICSGIGTILSFSMFFNSLLAMASEEQFWWWLDPVVALLCGLGALMYGLYGMYKAYVKDGYPIFSCKWWLYGGGGSVSSIAAGASRASVSGTMEQERHGNGREIGGGGELELQQDPQQQQQQQQQQSVFQRTDSLEGNPSLGTQSGISMMKTKSGDEMTDVVFT